MPAAFCLALASAGRRRLDRIAMMPMTTSNSSNVKARREPQQPDPFMSGRLNRPRREQGGCSPHPVTVANSRRSGGQRRADVDAVLEAVGGILHVFVGPPFETGTLFEGKLPNDLRRGAENEGAVGDFHSLSHERVVTDEARVADDCAVEDGAAHADQAFVADRAGVNDGGMADRHEVAEDRWEFIRQVHDGVVLDVGAAADDDAVKVTAENGAIPHARKITEGHVAKHDGRPREINSAAEGRLPTEEAIELGNDIAHGFVMEPSQREANKNTADERGCHFTRTALLMERTQRERGIWTRVMSATERDRSGSCPGHSSN